MKKLSSDINEKHDPNSLTNVVQPEIFFGIVAPIGVDIKKIVVTLNEALEGMDYTTSHIKITDLMKFVKTEVTLHESPLEERYDTYIKYANKVRENLDDGDANRGNDALAMLAVGAIRKARKQLTSSTLKTAHGRAYILDQFKRPEEIELLRRVYGRLFVQLSIHASRQTRKQILKSKIRASHSTGSTRDYSTEAEALIRRDLSEENELRGQRVQDAFPMAEVIIDGNNHDRAKEEITRFIRLQFGHNFITPTRDEYGMYMAKSAALRSADLSRQVGAAIFSSEGEVITLGANEVPSPKGGTYFEGDKPDYRDFAEGIDYNEIEKTRILQEIIKLLYDGGYLKKRIDGKNFKTLDDIFEHLLNAKNGPQLKDSRVMDLLEFGRQIHAEMSAICDAARLGKIIKGATLYCTAFPCHMCAKLILGSGISRVVYIDPYPKSYAEDMYPKSIALEAPVSSDVPQVLFEPFTGVAPYKYRDFFEKRRRKEAGGSVREWMESKPRPNVNLIYETYIKLEAIVVSKLAKKLLNADSGGTTS